MLGDCTQTKGLGNRWEQIAKVARSNRKMDLRDFCGEGESEKTWRLLAWELENQSGEKYKRWSEFRWCSVQWEKKNLVWIYV